MSETQKSCLKKVFTGIAIFAVVILMFVGVICENQIILGTICLAAFAVLGVLIYYWICDAAYRWRLMGAVAANETYLFKEWKYTIYEGHIAAGLRETKLDMETGEILIGASVFDKISGQGTVTNYQGFYTLSLSF